jgi:formylglycine-generating enzyme required for sulfatase activity
MGRIPCYFVNPKDGTEMVLVPGGWFQMGSRDDDPDAIAKNPGMHYVKFGNRLSGSGVLSKDIA